jgi:hypothetical protein
MRAFSDKQLHEIDTLRLTDRELGLLMATLDGQAGCAGTAMGARASGGKQRRKYERFMYRSRSALILTLCERDGGERRFLVRARNLSSWGMGFLHGGFLYTGTAVRILLKTTDDEPVIVAGMIVRCVHVRAHVHEIGVRFDEELDLSAFTGGK